MRGLVDTHSHLGDAAFDADRAEVLERARIAGVSTVITVSTNLREAQRNLELADEFPLLRPAAGLYPSELDLAEADAMIALLRSERARFCAIGEVGLDHWIVKDEAGREQQHEIFQRFIALAQELDLPLNVHSRSAGRQAIAMLIEYGARRVQLHAFDGRAVTALPAVEAGYFFSIAPSIVRSQQKQKLVKHLPLACLLVETDSPVLGVTPHERNEPANVVAALEAIAEMKHLSKEAVMEAVVANTQRLYGDLDSKIGEYV
jgi:TatD DNase family protein